MQLLRVSFSMATEYVKSLFKKSRNMLLWPLYLVLGVYALV
jgi:hypothetical protein